MAYIFLSYAKNDRDTAFAIRDLLEAEGFSLWLDKNQSALAEQFWPNIQANIRNAGAVIILVSDAAQKSAWLKREVDFAKSLQKPLFPILIQGLASLDFGAEISRLSYSDSKVALGSDFFAGLEASMFYAPAYRLPEQIFFSAIGQQEAREAPAPKETEAAQDTNSKPKQLWIAAIVAIIGLAISIVAIQSLYNSPPRSISISGLEQTRAAIEIILTTAAQAQSTPISDSTREYQAQMNQTAIAGNGVLPCTATVQWTETDHLVNRYRNPMNPPAWSETVPRRGLVLTLSEWIVNEEGVWYRVIGDDGMTAGYVRGRDLILSADCPR